MAANVFVSFDHDDQKQVGGFKLLKNNPKHPLDFRDHSLKEPVTDRSGKPIKFPPSDTRSKPVQDEILKKFDKCSKLVVLIGDDTHKSKWVEWEINPTTQLSDNDTTCCVFNPNRSTMYCALNIKLRCRVNSFFKMKKDLSGDNTWKRIRGMTLKGSDNATIPSALGDQSQK